MAGKFAGIVSVIVAAIGSVAGIMISQYLGQKNTPEVRKSFYTNMLLACGIAGLFTVLCTLFPGEIMGLYTTDLDTSRAAANYLAIAACSFLPMAGAAVLSAVIILTGSVYVEIYQVEPYVKQLTSQILFAYALVAPFKVLNMILGGGILRSGGKTNYVMVIDMIGT